MVDGWLMGRNEKEGRSGGRAPEVSGEEDMVNVNLL
jgi:hypothetical protein